MRWSWLRAAILGALIGPAPAAADAADLDLDGPDADRIDEALQGGALSGPHFYVWEEDVREARDWARELRIADLREPAWAHWRDAAASRAGQAPILTDALERDLERWLEGASPEAAATGLGFLLCLLPELDRTCLVSAWATSPCESTRRALAGALAAPFDALGVREAIRQLAIDASDDVRRLARSAGEARRVALA